MPLDYSKSKGSFSRNVAAERKSGRPLKQSLAIAYAVKRRGAKRGPRRPTMKSIFG